VDRSGDDYQNGITKEQAKALFLQDLAPFADGVNAKVTAAISQNQFDALVILVFNIGLGNFAGSSVLKLVTIHPRRRIIQSGSGLEIMEQIPRQGDAGFSEPAQCRMGDLFPECLCALVTA